MKQQQWRWSCVLSGVPFILALAGFACSTQVANTATATVAAPIASPTASVAVASPASPASSAPVSTPASAASAGNPQGTVLTGGYVVGVDAAREQVTVSIEFPNTPAVAPGNLTFRVDSNTKMNLRHLKSGAQETVSTFAALGLKANDAYDAVDLSFRVSSYDPATKTYLLLVIDHPVP
jgi:hypothetical protein